MRKFLALLAFAALPIFGWGAEGDTDLTNLVLSGDLTVGDDVTVADDVAITGDLTVSGATTISGAGGGVDATYSGIVTAEHFHSTDDVTITDDLTVSDGIDCASLTAASAVTVSTGTVSASGNITSSAGVVSGNKTIGNLIAITIANEDAVSGDNDVGFIAPFAGTIVAVSLDMISGTASVELDNVTQSEDAWMAAVNAAATAQVVTSFASTEFSAGDNLAFDFGAVSSPIGFNGVIYVRQTAVIP